jgi:hypothetical protein
MTTDTSYIYTDLSSNSFRVRCPGEGSVNLNRKAFTLQEAIRVRDAVLADGTYAGEKLRRKIYLAKAEKNARAGRFVCSNLRVKRGRSSPSFLFPLKESSNMERIKVGGLAVKNVKPIDQDKIIPTLESFNNTVLSKLGNLKQNKDWCVLGSALKKSSQSNDIDIAIDVSSMRLRTLLDACKSICELCSSINLDFNFMQGISIVSISYPIFGTSDLVQIDLIPTDDLDYTSWVYWSPHEKESKEIKQRFGLYRTEFIRAIASEIDKRIITRFEDGSPKTLSRYSFNFNTGLSRKIVSFEGKKGKTKTEKILTFDESFGHIKSPEKIIETLFGNKYTRESVSSYENVLDTLKAIRKDTDCLKDIKTKYEETLRRKKLSIPLSLNTMLVNS